MRRIPTEAQPNASKKRFMDNGGNRRISLNALCQSVMRAGFYEAYGEGGIRTLGSLLGYGALAKRCFRPLSHLTNAVREYRWESAFSNLEIGIPTLPVRCARDFIGVGNS
jgi:hypothetical protein